MVKSAYPSYDLNGHNQYLHKFFTDTIIIIQFFILSLWCKIHFFILQIYFYPTLLSIIILSFISLHICTHDLCSFLFIAVEEGFGPIYTLILVQAGLINW